MPPKSSSEKCFVIVTIYKYIEAESNISFNVTDVKKLVKLGMAMIDKKKRWCNACNHVENTVERIYWENNGIQRACLKIVINIDSDSEDKEAGESNDSDVDNEAFWQQIEMKTLSNHWNMCLQHVSVCWSTIY